MSASAVRISLSDVWQLHEEEENKKTGYIIAVAVLSVVLALLVVCAAWLAITNSYLFARREKEIQLRFGAGGLGGGGEGEGYDEDSDESSSSRDEDDEDNDDEGDVDEGNGGDGSDDSDRALKKSAKDRGAGGGTLGDEEMRRMRRGNSPSGRDPSPPRGAATGNSPRARAMPPAGGDAFA